MNSGTVLVLISCFLYATALPEPKPKYQSDFKIAQPNLRVRRFSEKFHYNGNIENLNNHQQPKPTWELNGNIARNERGQDIGQLSLDKHGSNYDVSAQWKQNLGERGPHADRTWVGINGQYRF